MSHFQNITQTLRTSLTFAVFLVVTGWASLASAQTVQSLFAARSGMCSNEASSRIAPPLYFQPLVNMSEEEGSVPCGADIKDKVVPNQPTVCTIEEPLSEQEPWFIPASLAEEQVPLIPMGGSLSCSITGDPDTCHSHPPLPAPLAWKLPGTGMTPPRLLPSNAHHAHPTPRTSDDARQRAWAPLTLGPSDEHAMLPKQPPRAS